MVEQRDQIGNRARNEPWTPRAVAAPRPNEGVSLALKGSFGSVPALPEDFVRLLDRLY